MDSVDVESLAHSVELLRVFVVVDDLNVVVVVDRNSLVTSVAACAAADDTCSPKVTFVEFLDALINGNVGPLTLAGPASGATGVVAELRAAAGFVVS